MAGTPIKLRVDVDLDAIIREAKKAGSSVDDLTKTFEDAGYESKVAAGLAQRAMADIEKSSSDAAEGVSKVGDASGVTGGALNSLGGVAKSALEGDVAGAADGALDAVSGLAQGIPVVGTAVGLAAGLASIAFGAMQADAKATEELVSGMYDDMIASGQRYLSAQYLQKAIGEITGDQGKYNDALGISKELGIGVNDVILAMAGDQKSLNGLLDVQNKKRQDEIDAVNASNASLDDKALKIDAINTKYGTQNDKFNDLLRAEDSAGKRFDTYQSASSDYLNGLIDSASEATRQVNSLGDEMYTLPDGTEIVVSAATGQATTDVTNFKKYVDDKTQPVEQTVKFRVDSSEWDKWTPMQKLGIVKAVPQSGTGVPWKQDI